MSSLGLPPISMDTIKKMASEMIAEQMGSHARDAYMAQNMSDLPVTYRQLLPAVSDRGQLAHAEQSIREQYRKDMATEVPRWAQKGMFLGNPSSPQAMEFHQRVAEAQAAFSRGDLDEAQRLIAVAKAVGDPSAAAAPPPPDVSKMTATQKIEYGLRQEREAREAGKGAARRQPPGAAVDVSKMTAGQKIDYGLSQESMPTRIGGENR